MDLILKSNKKGLKSYLKSFPHQGGIIVNDELKFIFMRAGKVAGTSILQGFRETGIDFFYSDKFPDRYREWFNSIDDHELENYFIFSVVRNPYDRFISSARYLKIPVNDLADNFEKHNQSKPVYLHTLPIYQYTHQDGILFADYICRFEALQFDLNQVCDYLKINRVELSILNRSKRKDYQHYYTDELKEKVRELYRNDIEYYGYSFVAYEGVRNSPFAYYRERLGKKRNGLMVRLGLK